MNNKLINIATNSNKYTLEIKEKLKDLLTENGYSYYEGFNPEAVLNITIGGDGAFLNGVRNSNYSEIPFVGINTGTLGFYPEVTPDNLESFIENYKNGNYKLNETYLIECEVYAQDCCSEKIYAINDIVIKRSDMKTTHLSVYIDDNHLETISGDGIIISSPMGSSAYNMAAGGSLVYPSLKTLQINPLSPIISNAYRCLDCSIIVPPEFEITIHPERKDDNIAFLTDGVPCEFENLEHARFRTSKKFINRLSTGTYNYWNIIKEKFL